nr:MAG TPA: hypothetical protein [Caudoviricetes sp.]
MFYIIVVVAIVPKIVVPKIVNKLLLVYNLLIHHK